MSNKKEVLLTANGYLELEAELNKLKSETRNEVIEAIKEARALALETIQDNIKICHIDYNKVKQNIREKLGKYFYEKTECRPMILFIITEV